ncbi:hypothetical protein MTO98_29345 [Mucilaginibacter sp. SMC90]|uniref:hypothetical protein n=1 Tax=Mucilaginibacter sp. SMC90 TaxID=2929803 RepID=UPI001FB31535|nr:hypothetical protein [Mucilaginibacter sp. SMC90]UOE48512.1 hypothetical protein MTO98_29345 [Mucilaginibacter sp. SMC90]
MKLNLNHWKTALLFTPFLIAYLLSQTLNNTLANYNRVHQISNILNGLNTFILIGIQAYLLIRFNAIAIKRNDFFKINALVPLIYVGVSLLYTIYLSVLKQAPLTIAPAHEGPVSLAQIPGYGILILVLVLHAFITFFFINNQYVSREIRKVQNPAEQGALINDFLNPMHLILKASVIAVVVSFVLSIFHDLLRF